MFDKILSMWKRATCRHEVDKLRFVRKIHGDEINLVDGKRYEYQCAVCGKMVYKLGPVTCEKCEYLRTWKNNGAMYCARCHANKSWCLRSTYRWMWTEEGRSDRCLK